jgi:hypothetical protein
MTDLTALRDLAADIGNLLRLADRLSPVLAAYAHCRPTVASPAHDQEPAGTPKPASARPRDSRKAPDGPRTCETCGGTFVAAQKGGARQRFCGEPCRNRAMVQRRAARKAQNGLAAPSGDDEAQRQIRPAAVPAPVLASEMAAGDGFKPERPLRVPMEDQSDPAFLRPPPLPWEQAAAGAS